LPKFRCTVLVAFVLGMPHYGGTADAVQVSLVLDAPSGEPSRYAFDKLKAALEARHVQFEEAGSLDRARGRLLVAAGIPSKARAAAGVIVSLGIAPPSSPESLSIRNTTWKGKPLLLVSGADERGLMYALLDVADRVAWASDAGAPFSQVRDAAETPAVADRPSSRTAFITRSIGPGTSTPWSRTGSTPSNSFSLMTWTDTCVRPTRISWTWSSTPTLQ
jgi:hypothetical protein